MLKRTLLGIATPTVMAVILVATAAPTLARTAQAVDQVVSQSQVAVKALESPATYQALEQAQNANELRNQSPIQTDGSTTGGAALLLVGNVALPLAGGALVYRAARQPGQRRHKAIIDNADSN